MKTGKPIKAAKEISNLSPVEREIASMVKSGASAKEIALKINRSLSEVNTHRKNIRKKLGINKSKISLECYLNQIIKNRIVMAG